ncbi:hypothetical protein SBRCBS47491_009828 [Sporothrix bragantina]|uniref:Subtilisin-like serine protease n=1 Tax=Sporothrix bragantina TaxID=671064 RepID=A0ABP0D0G7_9PEZI
MLPTSPPFPRSNALDHNSLLLVKDQPPQGSSVRPEHAGNGAITPITYLPGNPAVGLDPDEVAAHLTKVLATPLLDEIHNRLWFVARRASDNIDALNQNRVKKREIVATDDPKLHLTWGNGKIYLQPVPTFLLNYDVWTWYLHDRDDRDNRHVAAHRAAAVGFLRSFSLLVASPLDFALAKQAHLLPADSFDWLAWASFIRHFRRFGDEHVALRYHYGQLRLSRLNWALRLFRPRSADTFWFYEGGYWSIGDAVEKATLPLLFMFAIASSLLSAMQVALAVPADSLWLSLSSTSGLQQMARAFWVVSIALVLLLALSVVLIITVPFAVFLWQLQWAIRKRPRKGSHFAS